MFVCLFFYLGTIWELIRLRFYFVHWICRLPLFHVPDIRVVFRFCDFDSVDFWQHYFIAGSPPGPYSLVSKHFISFIRLHAAAQRRYVTAFILCITKPGTEIPSQHFFFCLFCVIGNFYFFWIVFLFFFKCVHREPSPPTSPLADIAKWNSVLSSRLRWRFICCSHLHR